MRREGTAHASHEASLDATALVVAGFRDQRTANGAVADLKAASRAALISTSSAIVVRKDTGRWLHIKETVDIGGGDDASITGVGGAAVGVLAGPSLKAPAAVAALIGGLARLFRSADVSTEELHRFGTDLEPGGWAILAVSTDRGADQVRNCLSSVGNDTVSVSLEASIANRLESGHDVAYSVLMEREGISVSSRGSTSPEIGGGMLVVDSDGPTASAYAATSNGIKVETIDMNRTHESKHHE